MKIKSFGSSSSGNCYWVSDGDTEILIECGISLDKVREGLGYKLNKVSACLVSHEHADHCKYLSEVLRLGIDVYMTKGTANCLIRYPKHNLKTISPLKKFIVGTLEITAFDVQHDADEPVGYHIKSLLTSEVLVFATDTYYTKYNFRNITHIMVECNYSKELLREDLEFSRKKRLLSSHFSLDNLIDCLKNWELSKCEEIYLLHLSDDNSDEKLFKRKIEAATGVPVFVFKK